MSIFEILDRKLEVLSSIFCGIKINLEWITPLTIFSDLPPNMSYPTINIEFFSTPLPLFRILETPYLPFVTERGFQTMAMPG